MRLSKSGEILRLITSFLGCISLAAASWSNSNTAEDAANLPHGNRCVTPQVRREWRALSDGENASWISAAKNYPRRPTRTQCLAKILHREYVVPYPNHVNYTLDPPLEKNTSVLDDFSSVHADLNPLIHFTGWFLPWHRSFIHIFERALREECGFEGTQPYWDWTKDADDFYNSPIFDPDPETGLGGWGDPSDDFQITTGAFAFDFVRPYPVPHCVRRNYTLISSGSDFGDGTPPTTQLLNTFFTPGSWLTAPQIIGGDMFGLCPSNAGRDCVRGPKWTPNGSFCLFSFPEGATMIDKLWDDWQRRHPENFWSYHGGTIGAHSAPGIYSQFPNGGPPFLDLGSDLPGDGLLDNATTFELMDIRAYDLCYTYE